MVRWRQLSTTGARVAIKRRAKQAGIEDSISGHSLRIGSAILLAQAGAGIPEMQMVGGKTLICQPVTQAHSWQSAV